MVVLIVTVEVVVVVVSTCGLVWVLEVTESLLTSSLECCTAPHSLTPHSSLYTAPSDHTNSHMQTGDHPPAHWFRLQTLYINILT